MSPESTNYFDMADAHLKVAEDAFAAGLYQIAAREAYLVALRVARGIIFEKTGATPKTHSGARNQLSKLVHEGLPIDAAFLQFMAAGFEVKPDLDYGPVSPVQRSVAEQAIITARAFLAAAKAVCEQ